VAFAGALVLAKFIPRGWFWDKMVLQASVAGDSPAVSPAANGVESLAGARGRTVSALRPMGEVEIAGRRHEARASLGSLERDEPVKVTGLSGRVLIVERDAS
jgi:membrane-bound serine protease (ClpP class)